MSMWSLGLLDQWFSDLGCKQLWSQTHWTICSYPLFQMTSAQLPCFTELSSTLQLNSKVRLDYHLVMVWFIYSFFRWLLQYARPYIQSSCRHLVVYWGEGSTRSRESWVKLRRRLLAIMSKKVHCSLRFYRGDCVTPHLLVPATD